MTKTRVFGLRLDPRQAWAWQRLGQNAIRNLIAPRGICVQCSHAKAETSTRNGWFCYVCQDALDQTSLLPSHETSLLVQQNQELQTLVKRLKARITVDETGSDKPVDHQRSLFDSS